MKEVRALLLGQKKKQTRWLEFNSQFLKIISGSPLSIASVSIAKLALSSENMYIPIFVWDLIKKKLINFFQLICASIRSKWPLKVQENLITLNFLFRDFHVFPLENTKSAKNGHRQIKLIFLRHAHPFDLANFRDILSFIPENAPYTNK